MQTENRVINEWGVFAAVIHEPIDPTARTTPDASQSRCLVRLAFYSEQPRGPARVFTSHSSRHRIPTRHGMADGPHEWLLGSHSDNSLGTARGPVRSRELTYPAGFASSGTCQELPLCFRTIHLMLSRKKRKHRHSPNRSVASLVQSTGAGRVLGPRSRCKLRNDAWILEIPDQHGPVSDCALLRPIPSNVERRGSRQLYDPATGGQQSRQWSHVYTGFQH
jgi:hypothetical protein